MRRIAQGIAIQYALEAEVTYTREFVPLSNDEVITREALTAAAGVSASVASDCEPMTGSEDFARFLDHVPGCFMFIGNGEQSAPLHNPGYDFNDQALLHGASLHVAIARRRLPVS
jgi:metal-dependent amidase/aminoacylase/carboxypeptidase family protein